MSAPDGWPAPPGFLGDGGTNYARTLVPYPFVHIVEQHCGERHVVRILDDGVGGSTTFKIAAGEALRELRGVHLLQADRHLRT